MNEFEREFARLVMLEATRAVALHGQFRSAHEAYGVLAEEFREFEIEVFKKRAARNPEDVIHELIQIAAVCQKAAQSLATLDVLRKVESRMPALTRLTPFPYCLPFNVRHIALRLRDEPLAVQAAARRVVDELIDRFPSFAECPEAYGAKPRRRKVSEAPPLWLHPQSPSQPPERPPPSPRRAA